MRAKLAMLLPAALLGAALGTAAPAQDGGPVTISDIRHETTERSTRIVVECSGALAYTYYSPDPLTLVVDIPEMATGGVPSRINVGSREVESLRLTQMARGDGRSLARLEVRLASLVPYQVYSKDRTLNLVFERSGAAKNGERDSEAALPPPAPPAAPAPASATPHSASAEPAAAAGEPAVAELPVEAPAPQARVSATPARPPAGKATRILSVTPREEEGRLTVAVRANGSLKYQDFFLGNPDRLVIDFKDVSSSGSYKAEVQTPPVRMVRLGQFSATAPKVARLVMDLSARQPYRIVDAGDGVQVVFGEGRTPAQAPLAALKPAPVEPAPAAPAPVLAAPAPVAPRTIVPAPLPAPVAARASAEAQGAALAEREAGTGPEPKRWTGHPISLDFKEGDLQDIFRLFADISGLNVVVNPGIAGRVTLKLSEVPWDQALDLILKINGLGYAIQDNVLRIAKLSDLQREEDDKRKLEDAKALAGDLSDWTRRVYYAKAQDLGDVIKKTGALSARGQINVDLRTNTLLMRDLPRYIDSAKALVDQLDIATPQVEIEARIVVTSRNFTRDLGIQWGFNQINSPRYGNTTNLTFPNSVIVNGQAVQPSSGVSPTVIGGPAEGIGGGTNRGYAVNLPASGFNSALGLSMGNILGNFNLDVALTALERQGRGRLLSTPKVTTQNNQSAEIKQGVQIPIQTVANNTVTVNFKDAVLTLRVTPQISEAGTVVLNLEVENNSADFANLVNGIPPINTQFAKTNVLVRDGSTAVIGGIYQSNETTSQSSTPFLGKLPILGYLFKNKFTSSTNNELLLFITPRIIKG